MHDWCFQKLFIKSAAWKWSCEWFDICLEASATLKKMIWSSQQSGPWLNSSRKHDDVSETTNISGWTHRKWTLRMSADFLSDLTLPLVVFQASWVMLLQAKARWRMFAFVIAHVSDCREWFTVFSQPGKQKKKFSSFFKSLVIELDKDLYGPDNHLVEVSHGCFTCTESL